MSDIRILSIDDISLPIGIGIEFVRLKESSRVKRCRFEYNGKIGVIVGMIDRELEQEERIIFTAEAEMFVRNNAMEIKNDTA